MEPTGFNDLWNRRGKRKVKHNSQLLVSADDGGASH